MMTKHSELAANLLRDAAVFYRQIADTNPSVASSLRESAETFDAAATLVESDPNGVVQLDPPETNPDQG